MESHDQSHLLLCEKQQKEIKELKKQIEDLNEHRADHFSFTDIVVKENEEQKRLTSRFCKMFEAEQAKITGVLDKLCKWEGKTAATIGRGLTSDPHHDVVFLVKYYLEAKDCEFNQVKKENEELKQQISDITDAVWDESYPDVRTDLLIQDIHKFRQEVEELKEENEEQLAAVEALKFMDYTYNDGSWSMNDE